MSPSREQPSGNCDASATEVAKIAALVRLLGDDDPKICSVAWDNLEKIGEAALPVLREATIEASDVRVQTQSARFLKEWSRRVVFRRWVEFCRQGHLQLEEGIFLIAETEYPQTDMAEYRQRLDEYASVLRGRLASARSTDEAVGKIASFLFSELGFKGDSAEYYNPENSYLNRVMDRRRGIPISLSTVFLLVGRRLSVPVFGVGLPRHFLLKYRGASGEVFVDSFHAGRLLSIRDCVQFLSEAHVPFLEEYLRAVTDAEMLTRSLGNLLKIYLECNDQRRYDRISSMLKVLS
jgi:regulator of sirC expression with transglutaminase-like and TPR domain